MEIGECFFVAVVFIIAIHHELQGRKEENGSSQDVK
jgi:hypothetical protein